MAKGSHKVLKRVIGIVVAVLVIACAGFSLYMTQSYHADATAQTSYAQAQEAGSSGGEYSFGNPECATGIILYPGASVPYEAYAPLAQAIADEGYFVAVMQMPLNFGFLGVDKAQQVIDAHPQIGTWWVGGHSLGGVCAAMFAGDHANEVSGVILLAAYSSTDLSSTGLRVLSIRGSNDQVLQMDQYEGAVGNLPADSAERVIDGGNHGQMGSYGKQAGDGEATITPEDQWKQVAQAIKNFVG